MNAYGPFISRDLVKERGYKHYFTGVPCKHGHISPRFTARCQCCWCNTLKVREDWKSVKSDPQKHAAAKKFQRERARTEDPTIKRKRGLKYIQKKRRDPAFLAKEVAYRRSPARRRYLRGWNKQRMEDPGFRILRNLRNRVWSALNGRAASSSTTELLGCSIPELKQHLQGQFTSGMSWENYGEWHPDHIRPCRSFDLTDPEQQRACFFWANLQPLDGPENHAKSDTWTPEMEAWWAQKMRDHGYQGELFLLFTGEDQEAA